MRSYRELSDYIAQLNNVDVKDDVAFAHLLLKSQNIRGLTNKQIAEQFGCSTLTVARWRTGRTSPNPTIRNSIYQYLAKQAASVIPN